MFQSGNSKKTFPGEELINQIEEHPAGHSSLSNERDTRFAQKFTRVFPLIGK